MVFPNAPRLVDSVGQASKVRLALRDSQGRILGYKADSSWNLADDPSSAKPHTRINTDDLTTNLIFELNDRPGKYIEGLRATRQAVVDNSGTLVIDVEDFSGGARLYGFVLSRNGDGIYSSRRIE